MASTRNPTAGTAMATVLDMRTVGQLRSIPGRTGSLFDDMVPIFLRTSTAQIDRIRDRVAAGDLPAAAHSAFQLVGACGSFGARRMCTTALRLRQALLVPSEGAADPGHDGLLVTIDLLTQELRSVTDCLDLIATQL